MALSRPIRRLLWVLGLLALVLLPAGFYAYRHPQVLLRAGLLSVRDQPLRRAYEREVAQLAAQAAELERQGVPLDEIARTVHQRRRDIGIKYKDLTPAPLRERIYEINRQRYGDPLGPTFEFLVKNNTRDGVVDYRAIIAGASRTNRDVDGLLSGPR